MQACSSSQHSTSHSLPRAFVKAPACHSTARERGDGRGARVGGLGGSGGTAAGSGEGRGRGAGGRPRGAGGQAGEGRGGAGGQAGEGSGEGPGGAGGQLGGGAGGRPGGMCRRGKAAVAIKCQISWPLSVFFLTLHIPAAAAKGGVLLRCRPTCGCQDAQHVCLEVTDLTISPADTPRPQTSAL